MSRAGLIVCGCSILAVTACTKDGAVIVDAGPELDGDGDLAKDARAIVEDASPRLDGALDGQSDAKTAGLCMSGGWCWANPTPQGAALRSVWASAPNDVWAVGDTILHFDGSSWAVFDKVTTASLQAVWGIGPADVWAVGEAGTILHWNGSAWSGVASGVSTSFTTV